MASHRNVLQYRPQLLFRNDGQQHHQSRCSLPFRSNSSTCARLGSCLAIWGPCSGCRKVSRPYESQHASWILPRQPIFLFSSFVNWGPGFSHVSLSLSLSLLFQSRQAGKPDNRGALGKILRSVPVSESNIDAKHLLSSHPFVYDVELILGGKLTGWQRPTLQYTTAAAEGMTGESKRRKRKQTNLNDAYTTETNNNTNAATSKKIQTTKKTKRGVKSNSCSSGGSSGAKSTAASSKSGNNKRGPKGGAGGGGHDDTKGKSKRQKTVESNTAVVEPTSNVVEVDMFERHMREFEKSLARLEKVDAYQYFMENDVPPEFDECYDNAPTQTTDDDVQPSSQSTTTTTSKNAPHTNNPEPVIFPNHPPFNFVVLRKRMEKGRYILDRELMEIEDRIELIKPYYKVNKKPIPVRYKDGKKKLTGFSVFHAKGVNWDLFRMDIRGMCDQAVRRNSELVKDNGAPGSLSYSARKIKDLLDQIYEKTGLKQTTEMEMSNDRRRFAQAMESSVNNEAAIQGKWKRDGKNDKEKLGVQKISVLCWYSCKLTQSADLPSP